VLSNLILPSIASPGWNISPEIAGYAVKACVIYNDTDVLIDYIQ